MMGALLAVEAVLLGLILASLWVVLYQLVKQQGRLLLRLDEVERRLARGGQGAGTRGLGVDGAEAAPRGLAVGTPIAPFRLPDLTGQEIPLEEFRGQRVLLTHWNPRCGFCDLMAPDLAGLQADLKQRNVQLVLVSHGDAGANREFAQEHGLECPILLQQDTPALEAFQHLGTPVA